MSHAIKSGYRHIDCAWIYGNEVEVAEGIAEGLKHAGLKREDLWVTSKLWNTFHQPEHVRPALEESLKALRLEYLDLYLMHWPVAFAHLQPLQKTPKNADGKVLLDDNLCNNQASTWKAMEPLVEAGLVRNIGISNFSPGRIKQLLMTAKIPPAVNQVELHPKNAQPELARFCKSNNIHLTAYSPLGSQGTDLLENPEVVHIAESKGVDAGRILIAWGLSRGTSVIPKSVTASRIESNFGATHVHLSPQEMKTLDALDKGQRYVNPSKAWGIDIYEEKKQSKV